MGEQPDALYDELLDRLIERELEADAGLRAPLDDATSLDDLVAQLESGLEKMRAQLQRLTRERDEAVRQLEVLESGQPRRGRRAA